MPRFYKTLGHFRLFLVTVWHKFKLKVIVLQRHGNLKSKFGDTKLLGF
jgi:hypothetical protein